MVVWLNQYFGLAKEGLGFLDSPLPLGIIMAASSAPFEFGGTRSFVVQFRKLCKKVMQPVLSDHDQAADPDILQAHSSKSARPSPQRTGMDAATVLARQDFRRLG
jgi:hypothetical protein